MRTPKRYHDRVVMSRFAGYGLLPAVAVVIVLLLPWCSSPAEAANMLAVQTISSKSHWNVMKAVLRALVDRGHNVTVFTSDGGGDNDDPRPNYNEVDMSRDVTTGVEQDVAYVIENYGPTASVMTILADRNRRQCDAVFRHHRMMDILRKGNDDGSGDGGDHFDVVIIDPLMSECMAYVAAELDVPIIYVFVPPVITYLERSTFGQVSNPAVVSHLLFGHGAPTTFAERFANTLLTVYCASLKWYVEWRLIASTRPQPYDRPAARTVKPSVIFANTYFITEAPGPLPPGVVQIGGIHLGPSKSIPEDILQFIEDSPHGVIYVTFGSIISMTSLPETMQKAFRETLARVKQKVLWKYKGEMIDKPANVLTRKWFPQRDILLHPNVKLFISHGGVSGVYEAVDAGVPVLGLPFFYDQPRNVANLVDIGMAISLDPSTVTEETLLAAVSELVYNESYRENAKVAAVRFKDRPVSPAESVVFWTEYVLRHKGAPHLKSSALDLTWYQYFMIDVIITVASTVFAVLFVAYRGMKVAYERYVLRNLRKPKTKRE